MLQLEYHWLGLSLMAAALASVHVWFPRFDDRFARHTDRWMGFVGGVATCYVTLFVLPKLGWITSAIMAKDTGQFAALSHLRMYHLLLTAIVVYLLMIHLDASEARVRVLARVFDFAVHGAYSFLAGYVYVELTADFAEINALICIILGLHLLGMDHLLRAARRAGFDRAGRWIYFLLVLLGAGLGVLTELPKPFTDGMTAFLAGIILVNVIAEELPIRHRSRVPWYLGGLAFYLVASFVIMQWDPRPTY